MCGTDTELIYSAIVSYDIENTININLNQPLRLVALFISRLLKGLQNLTNCKDDLVFFLPVYDPNTGEYALYVNDIQWSFESSRFFGSFTVSDS